VDINASLAPYSNFGDTIDVAAPGGDFSTDLNGDGYVDGVLSTGGDDSSGAIQNVYTFFQGTSMAAPHMAAVAALMKAVRPDLSPDDLDGFLQSGAIVRDIGAAGRDDLYGYGLIDASRAVQAARDGSVPTVLNISPSAVSLGSALSTATLTASQVGAGALSITRVTDNADWLTVSASDTDASGLGTYTVTADRGGLSDGAYNAVITFVTTENTVEVQVNLRISSAGLAPDAGFQYVLLVDSRTDETVDQVSMAGTDGRYNYQFNGVEPGNYRIFAGTDSDNDFNIGDAGEAIGAYLSTDQPTVLTVEADRSGLDFITEFNVNIPEPETSGLAVPIGRTDAKTMKKVN
jgi:serine protease